MTKYSVKLSAVDLDILFRSFLTVRGITVDGPVVVHLNGVNLGKHSTALIEAIGVEDAARKIKSA